MTTPFEHMSSNASFTSYHEAIDTLRVIPDGAERLEYAMSVPLLFDVDDYDELPANRPTPLDTENVFVVGRNGKVFVDPNEPPISYRKYAVRIADNKAMRVFALPDNEASFEALSAEAIAQVLNRCDHNTLALDRLKHLMANEPAPDHLLEILLRLRSGMANLPEMLDVIKRYPAMGSIQTSDFVRFFDKEAMLAAVRQARIDTASLGHTFRDAFLEMDGEQTGWSDSDMVAGVKVHKYRLGRLRSETSDTEHMLKIVYVPTANGMEPCSVSTYFRPKNYKDYEGYAHEPIDDWDNQRYGHIDVTNVKLDDTALAIEDDEYRKRYLQALHGAALKRAGMDAVEQTGHA